MIVVFVFKYVYACRNFVIIRENIICLVDTQLHYYPSKTNIIVMRIFIIVMKIFGSGYHAMILLTMK